MDEYQDLPIDIRKGGVVVALEQYCIYRVMCNNVGTLIDYYLETLHTIHQ